MTREEIKVELIRYLPVLERAEADPEIWEKLTKGLGIATLNGLRKAVSAVDQLDKGFDDGPGSIAWECFHKTSDPIAIEHPISNIGCIGEEISISPKPFNPRDRRKIFPLPE
jgi:hypothetical protein